MYVVDSIYVSNEDPEKQSNGSKPKKAGKREKKYEKPDGKLGLVKYQIEKTYNKIQNKSREYITKETQQQTKQKRRRKRENQAKPAINHNYRRQSQKRNEKTNQKIDINEKIAIVKEQSGIILFLIIAVLAFAGSTIAFSSCEESERNIQWNRYKIFFLNFERKLEKLKKDGKVYPV